MTKARTLHDVIRIIDELADDAALHQDRIGYFIALYRHVAVRFAWAIARDEFDDPEGMERLDVVFFDRYLTALEAWRAGRSCSRCWEGAFRATKDDGPTVVQHLLAGMNAHIDFDLGIAVADSEFGQDLAAFKPDFDKMNALLADLVGDVLADLTTIWPLLRMINRLFGLEEDLIINFSMKAARDMAWAHAVSLSKQGPSGRAREIRDMDFVVTAIGEELVDPPFPFSAIMAWVRHGEQGSVAEVIRDLLVKSGEPPTREQMHAAFDRARGGSTPTPQPDMPPAPSPPDPAKRRRVVVLGAGQSALTAAFQLTHPGNPASRELDVTVYQLGWRLGGKGATGRNPDFGYRIEEHGLHNWFGFYDNSFRQIQDCYAELGRAPDAPLASWQEAFHPANEAVFTEDVAGKHLFWVIRNPPNLEVPGSPGLLLPLWEYALMAIEGILGLFEDYSPSELGSLALDDHGQAVLASAHDLGVPRGPAGSPGHELLLAALELARRGKTQALAEGAHGKIEGILRGLFGWVDLEVQSLENDACRFLRHLAVEILGVFMKWLWRHIEPALWTDTPGRRLWILANFGYGILAGVLEDDIIERGFDVINEHNFRAWLAKYAFDDGGVLLASPIVRAVYDSSFAYQDGDTTIPDGHTYPPKESFEAGTALRGMVRSVFTYKGAFGYRFAAGTADTCYAPMYLVMQRRGVRFELFHQVLEVVHDDHVPGKPVVKIRIARQVAITPEQQLRGGYEPLIDVKGLPCWPSTPRWEQIVDGKRLRTSGLNLECPPRDFVGCEEIVLERGRDFDDVVLGISIAALPWLCGRMIQSSASWQASLRHVKTVRTQGLQLWLKRTSCEMGFPVLGAPIAAWDYDRTNSLNVWGDLTELLPFEGWPVSPYPLNLSYYTSPLPDDPAPAPDEVLPPSDDCDAQALKVRANAIRLLNDGAYIPWPKATTGVPPARGFDWELLVDLRPGQHAGQDRIDSQFYKANVALTERYVLSVPGSSKHRLQAHDNDEFSNLYLAGDWTWCGLNVGAMESATMSGMLCSLALSGFPERKDIAGVDFGTGM